MVKEWKKKQVDELSKLVKTGDTVGLVDIKGLPSKQFQLVRKSLRGRIEIKVVKKRILLRALEKAGLADLAKKLPNQSAIFVSDQEPFELFREIKSLRHPASAKPGMVAQADIIVAAGGTGLPPGPVIGELQAAGLPAKIEKGQIIVQKDTVIAKPGDVLTKAQADALTRLEIKPFEVGLEITAMQSGGIVYDRTVLDVDIEQIQEMIGQAASAGFSFAYAINWPVPEIIELKLGEAARHALALATELDWMTADTAQLVLSKAHAQALALKTEVD
ncbi:MAG: 50S ribosomal protein L10 [Candidatus Altiarchaeota archaeon]|nr:50S ribosomal protein L10 [Candidatus Altiarchaeota archaeon]